MKMTAVVLSVIAFFTCQLSAVEVLNSDYSIESYASYTKPGLKTVMSLAFDDGGNLYLSHAYESIWKVTPNGNASEFVKGVSVRGLVWGGGTAFGNYLYSPDGLTSRSKINKIALDGTVTSFASFDPPKHNPYPAAIDTIGNYGGAMFTATSGQDRTYKVTSTGVVSLFADFPGWRDGGGPSDLLFDKTGNYGNQLYMATAFSNVAGNEYMSGLWKLAPNGQATRLIPEKVFPACLDIDGYGDFNGKMYLLARTTLEGVNEIWVVEPDGSHFVFAKTTQTGICDLIFGADGALYVAEYAAAQEKIVISKIVLDNANLVALEIAGPNEVAEDAETQYRAVAYYDNGRNRDLTNKVRWFTEDNEFAGIDANGLFWCDKVFTLDAACTIYAEIEDANQVFTAQKQVKIIPMCSSGLAIKLDGMDDYVNLGNSTVIKPQLPVTISCWLNISKMEHAMGVILLGYSSSRYTGIWMDVFLDKKIQISFGDGGGQDPSRRRTFRANKVLEENKWYYITAVIRGSTDIAVYIDGVAYDGEYSGTGGNIVYSNGESRLGFGLVNNLEYYFNGLIDVVAIFSRALSAEEIQYNMNNKLSGTEVGLVGYWDFDEGQGQIAHDKSGHGNNGILGGTENIENSDPAWFSLGHPCSRNELIKRNLSTAKEIKQDILSELDYALKAEAAAQKMLVDMQRERDFGLWKMFDIIRARVYTQIAVLKEYVAKEKIQSSQQDLSNALNMLEDPEKKIKDNKKP